MGRDNIGGYQVDRFRTGFYAARIGETVFGFSDQDEDESGGIITIMARSQIGDAADIMKNFPQITYNEYMYERSYAQIQFLVGDSTHTHYLKGKDKKIIENYQQILKAQASFDSFLSGGSKHRRNVDEDNE